MIIEVGKPCKPFIGMGEGVRFSLSGDGALLAYCFDNPTEHEIAQMKSGKSFEIRCSMIDKILWITSKCGDLAWTDAPYNPRLSQSLLEWDYDEGEGIALTLVMIDSKTGIVKAARLIGLGTMFSRYLVAKTLELRDDPMTEEEAAESIKWTMARASSEYLAKIAPSYGQFRL